MDRVDPDQLVSTMVDDVFFVVQKCTRRALATQQVDCICAVFNNANTVLEEDFGSVLVCAGYVYVVYVVMID